MANKTTISLEELIQSAESHLRNSGYTDSTIKRYHYSWKVLLKRCLLQGIEQFSYESCIAVVKQEYHILTDGKLTQSQVFHLRTIKILDEFAKHGRFFKCHQKPREQVNLNFSECLKLFISASRASGLTDRTVEAKTIQVIRFLNYISNNGIENIKYISADYIISYAKSLKDASYARSTRSGILFTLRSFLSFLHDKQYISEPLQGLFPVIFSNKSERIPSYYSEDELKKILLHVNRDEIIGKRDYLILLLAIQLGIRAGDIRMLKLEYIHWEKNTIEFTQQKTKNPIQLPLPENVKFAMIDYIKNGRPKSSLPYIFLRHRAPYDPYVATNVFHDVITRYLIEAGISFSGRKHGLHSARHSLASNLLKNNTPYPVITGILGHENTSTTRSYLAIDINQLRSVALEVPYEE
ncbi:site-specific integrase [Acetivibrio cellulolyticus]|uniref:site-specific integrase n=1 Tax=Acetivibrio cellulolyticus TaxID=35830 RepID=UPI0002481AE0|nr:site-specific integrase [Acetivibrio cellulolyticus]